MSAISPIDGVLSQMRGLAEAAAARPTPGIAQALGSPKVEGGFAAELAKAVQSVSNAQLNAMEKQRHFVMGKEGVQLNDVMIDMQKASIGFQAAVQVRNKVVTAYQTIASMPI